MGRRAGRRCAREGCRAWALRGGETCRAHTARSAGEGGRAARDAEGDDASRREERVSAFQQRLESANFRNLLPEKLTQIIAEAGREGSLTDEIGSLRVVLKRLMDEERDSQRLSESIPRVVNATVRALKAQRAISGETAGDLTEALTRVLLEIGLGE